jgi:hypothetical protein
MENKGQLVTGLIADERPETIEDLKNGRGTVNYNHNIQEILVKEEEGGSWEIVTDPEEATGTKFMYDCLRVEYPITRNNILATLITAKYDANTESKLVNDYQAAMIGILDESFKEPYIAFLRDRLVMKQMVENDCVPIGIPEKL